MDGRRFAAVVLAGLLLPVLTVFVVLTVAQQGGVPPIISLLALVVGPLFAIVMTYASAIVGSLSVPFEEHLPMRQRRTFRDRIPDHYHDTFSVETLDQPVDDSDSRQRSIITMSLLYLVSIPIYTLLLWLFTLA
jgi:hypothetical protein